MSQERGAPICKVGSDYVRGPEAIGDQVGVNVPLRCPAGGEPVGSWHTHPSNSTRPSGKDMSEARRLGLKFVCITAERSRETICTLVQPS